MPKSPDSPSSPLHQLLDLDRKIIRLLGRRAELLKDLNETVRPTAAGGPGKAKSDLEKRLRQAWEQAASSIGGDPGLWRKSFSLLQELGSTQLKAVSTPMPKRSGFELTPAKGSMSVDIAGPGSMLQSVLWTILAFQSEQPLTIANALRNDALFDCVKACNHGGAQLYWEEDGLKSRGAAKPAFAGKAIFVGQEPVNLFAQLFLALPHAGSVRFIGGPQLKLLDLRPLADMLPALGARLVMPVPGAHGLPARLETSGIIPDSLQLSANFPPEAAAALAAAAPSYPRGLSLILPEKNSQALVSTLEQVQRMLDICGIDTDFTANILRIAPGRVSPPPAPAVDIDPFLGGAILALSLAAGGVVRLRGTWPNKLLAWRRVESLLMTAGINLTGEPFSIQAAFKAPTAAQLQQQYQFDTRETPELMPLALAIATCLASHNPDVAQHLRCGLPSAPETLETVQIAEEVLERTGFQAQIEDSWLTFEKAEPSSDWDAPWSSPSPAWSLAYALLGYIRPGLKLDNPGNVTGLMPGFWPFYNALPTPPVDIFERKPPKEDKDAAPQPKRRRRKVE